MLAVDPLNRQLAKRNLVYGESAGVDGRLDPAGSSLNVSSGRAPPRPGVPWLSPFKMLNDENVQFGL